MNAKSINKVSITIIAIVVLWLLLCVPKVSATDNILQDDFDNVVVEKVQQPKKSKIVMYDSVTNQTTEINMTEVKNSILSTNNTNGGIVNHTEPYDPYPRKTILNSIASYNDGLLHKVSDTSVFPHRVTCRISFDVYGAMKIASGFLVGKNLLLTSAHCVMNEEDNDNTFAEWVAWPGYNRGDYNGISSGWSKIIYPADWKNDHSTYNDWCLCILNEDIGSQVGWFGCQSYGVNSEMKGLAVRNIGYPVDYNTGSIQYYTIGNIQKVDNYTFTSGAASYGGMSGGPIARTSDNYAVGINRGDMSPTIGAGVRISQDIINLILENG